jgi:hypothetical protein
MAQNPTQVFGFSPVGRAAGSSRSLAKTSVTATVPGSTGKHYAAGVSPISQNLSLSVVWHSLPGAGGPAREDALTLTVSQIVALVGTEQLPSNISSALRNNAGSHWNHALFWKVRLLWSFPQGARIQATALYKVEVGGMKVCLLQLLTLFCFMLKWAVSLCASSKC